MEVRLLGSGGFMPSDRRETACALLRKDGAALAIDAGSGARRLVSQPELLRGIDRIHVVLTHFHLDHTLGLFYLVDAGVPIEVWAAGEALEETRDGDVAPSAPRLPVRARRLPAFVHASRAAGRRGARRAVLGAARIQRRHSNPTLALRFDEAIAWCTDTAYDEGNVAFVRGAHTLFHEAFRPGDGTDDPTHTGAGQAGRLAAAAGVERLVLIHVDPELEDDEVLLQHARAHFASTEVGCDGASFST